MKDPWLNRHPRVVRVTISLCFAFSLDFEEPDRRRWSRPLQVHSRRRSPLEIVSDLRHLFVRLRFSLEGYLGFKSNNFAVFWSPLDRFCLAAPGFKFCPVVKTSVYHQFCEPFLLRFQDPCALLSTFNTPTLALFRVGVPPPLIRLVSTLESPGA